ncbi:MAG: hypothetical protein ABI992_10985 [Chthoniobacterales bacterium]
MSAISVERITPRRALVATVIVILTVLLAWKVIDYRTQPPRPPRPAGAVG